MYDLHGWAENITARQSSLQSLTYDGFDLYKIDLYFIDS